MYLEHFWLSVIGIFMSGVLSMLGIMIAVDMHEKAKRPRMPIKGGFDPRNPINRNSVLNRMEYTAEDGEWYEVKPIEWR